jgi:P-type conjugative transfer protein TrbJ
MDFSRRHSLRFAATVVAIGLGASTPAMACLFGCGGGFGGIVFDPTNFAKNTVTATQSIIQEINALKQIEAQLKANAGTLGSLDQSNAAQQIANVQKLRGTAQNMLSSIGTSQSIFGEMQAMYGAGQYQSWNQFGQSMARRRAAGEATAKNLLSSSEVAYQQIEQSSQAHQSIAASLSGVSGVTEATQATASSVGVLITQNQALLGLMAASNAESAQKITQERIKDENQQDSMRTYEQKNRARLNELQNKWKTVP